MMKRRVIVGLVIGIGCMIAGCSVETGTWNTNKNGVYVSRELGVQSALVYTSEQNNDAYQEAELQTFVQDIVTEYNTSNGENVLLESCALNGSTGMLTFKYETPADFVEFSQATGDNTHAVTNFSVMKVSDALTSGILADINFLTAAGKPTDRSTVTKKSDYVAVVTEGAILVQTEGPIRYVSEGVVLQDSFTALTPEGISNIIFE